MRRGEALPSLLGLASSTGPSRQVHTHSAFEKSCFWLERGKHLGLIRRDSADLPEAYSQAGDSHQVTQTSTGSSGLHVWDILYSLCHTVMVAPIQLLGLAKCGFLCMESSGFLNLCSKCSQMAAPTSSKGHFEGKTVNHSLPGTYCGLLPPGRRQALDITP